MHNFTVADLVQTTWATFAFALFLIPPGYLLCLAANLFGIRSRSAAEQLLLSTVFSFAATPVLAVLITRASSSRDTIAFFLLLASISLVVFVRRASLSERLLPPLRRGTVLLFCMMLAWFLVVQFALADLQIGHRVYVSFVAFDHSVRVPLVEAAARGGVPPRNPFFGLGTPPVLRYFYYWYVLCSLPMRLFALSARACFNASVFWSGVGLAAIIPLFLKYFSGETSGLRRKSVIGIALLAVTGLDLLPYAANTLRFHVFLPDMEWWDPNQVTSWVGSLLWVPHHVASLTACMAGLLVLSTIDEQNPLRQRVWAAVLAAMAFASAAGLSVYVTFTFAVFATLWTLQTLRQKKLKTLITYVATVALSLLLSWPYLLDLRSMPIDAALSSGGGGDGGQHLASFAIRDFPDATVLLGKLGIHSELLLEAAKLPVLLVVYILEFGFFAVILILCLRRDLRSQSPLSTQRHMAWWMFVVCMLTVSFLKSESTPQNDLGFRGILIVQFILLIWAAPMVHDLFFSRNHAPGTDLIRPWVRTLLITTLVIGVAGSFWQLIALRSYAPLADLGKIARAETFLGPPGAGFAERTYWLREGYFRLDQLTSSTASVQYNPVRDEVFTSHLYSTRQAAMGDAFCGAAFGGDVAKCRVAFPSITKVFNDPDAVRNLNLDNFCDEFQVNVLVVNDTDPVWKDPRSWVWTRSNLLSNPSMRAVSCGKFKLLTK